MGIVDPIAMTNVMATGGLDFGGGGALGLTLLGLLAGCTAAILFARARPWGPSMRGLPRWPHLGRPTRFAGAAK